MSSSRCWYHPITCGLSLLILMTSVPTAADQVAESDAASRPNFLFIAVDDLNDFAGYAANEPGNFLQVIYPDAQVRAEVCQRLTPNYDTLKDAITLPQQLRRSGYFTTGLGKLFHTSRGSVDGPIKNDWADAKNSWSQWVNHPNGCNGGQPSKYSPPDGGNMVFGPSRLLLKDSGDWMAADFAARLLEQGVAETLPTGRGDNLSAQRVSLPSDQPFFLGCGLFRPHLPFHAPQNFFDLFPVDEMTGLNRQSLDAIIADLHVLDACWRAIRNRHIVTTP